MAHFIMSLRGSKETKAIPCIFCFVIAIMLCSAIAVAAVPNTISRINIYIADGQTHKTAEEQVRAVLPIREGDAFTAKKLDEALNFLRRWGIFETINASTTPSASGTAVDFYLQEAIIIGDIEIMGNYPYVEPKIKKYLTIRPGDMYTRPRIDDQMKRIKEFYEREGFFNTVVTTKEAWNEANKDVTVTFKIKHGSLLRYRDIIVTGSATYPKGRMVSAINPLRPYKPRNFNDAIRKVSDFYRRHGYPRARVEVVSKDFDVETGRVDVNIRITEGPHVKVKFDGNHRISTRKLKKELTIFEEGSFDEYELEATADAILDLYHKNGFVDASVSFSRSEKENGDIIISFQTKEGPKQKIRTIKFSGNKAFHGQRLKKQMKTRDVYNEKRLADDLKAIKKYYNSEGYPDAAVGGTSVAEELGRLNIEIPITEGDRKIIKDVSFSGGSSFESKVLSKQLKNTVRHAVDTTSLEDDKQTLLIFYADHGYPYAEIKQAVEYGETSAVVKYEIIEGPIVKIGQILVLGNQLTSTRAIKKALGIKEGEPFSYQKITDGQIALRRLGAFNAISADTIGLNEREETVHLRVKVEEQKPLVLDFEAGYSTDERYSGTISLTNFNTFGLAKRSNLKLTGGRELSRAETNWTDPKFAGSDLEMTVSSWLQYEDKNVYNYTQAGGGFGFFRRYHRTGLLAKWELTRNYFIQGDSVAADADSLRDNTISKVSLSASFDTRNNFADPTRGIFAMMTSDFYNEIRGKEANFVKLRWFFGQYIGFLKYLSLANNIRIDRLQEIGNNLSIPTNELFALGGDDTLRGFSEDRLGPVNATGQPTGGRVRWIYNSELRMKVFRNWKVAGFYDTGALVNEFNQIDLGSVRQSAGVGLRYMTPVGPLRFDYGFIIDRAPGEHLGRFHLTFGYVF